MAVRSKSISTLAVAVVLFGLAGLVMAALVPQYFVGASAQPPFVVFLVVGVGVIALTAGLFAFVERLGMGFGRTALALAAGYNAMIAAVKLELAPAALYEANQEQSFDVTAGDPNTLPYYLVVGGVVLALYVAAFAVMYRIFRRRFRRRAEAQASAAPSWAAPAETSSGSGLDETASSDAPPARRRRVMVAGVVLVAVGLGLWWVPVFLVGLPVLSYLSYIFTTFGAAILLALVVAGVLAWMTFDKVERRAAGLGDATLLAGFFWFGLALILLYHVMWAVFLLTLVSIWPFQTYTPK